MKKRAYKIFSVCAVFSILLSSLCVFSSASAADLSNSFPPSPSYPNSDFLPYGEDTISLCVLYRNGVRHYMFFARSQYVSYTNSNIWTSYWYTVEQGTTRRHYIYIESYAPIISNVITGNSSGYSEVGTWNSNLQLYQYVFELYRSDSVPLGAWCSYDQRMNNLNLKAAQAAGYTLRGTDQDQDNYYWKVRPYPDSIQDSISNLEDLYDSLDQSVNDFNSELQLLYDSLDENFSVLSSQVDSLNSNVSELQSQVRSQSGEYQSALDQAQSEIQSNANAAASQAADDVNNAGEDMSDIDDDVSDVNSIVDTLDEWISQLDDYSETIDEAASDVADSMEQGKSLISGFLGICPPIVIALFAFALVFIVVRKVIGR